MLTSEITVMPGKRDVRVVPYAVAMVLVALLAAVGFGEYMETHPPTSVSTNTISVPSAEQIEDAGMSR